MGRRVLHRERARSARHKTDQPLARAQPGRVHGFGVQPVGRRQLKRAGGPDEIDRAHIRGGFFGDHVREPVQTRLRVILLRHQIPDPGEQAARTAHGGGEAVRRHRTVGRSLWLFEEDPPGRAEPSSQGTREALSVKS